MASYIQININTANAPHFATWYHNRSGQAMSFLTAAVLNYAIKRQFLLIGYAPKDISLEELPKVFQIRIKGNESLVKWENDLKMASLCWPAGSLPRYASTPGTFLFLSGLLHCHIHKLQYKPERHLPL